MAIDPETLGSRAVESKADAIAISTYNGVALSYTKAVLAAMEARGLDVPVLVGGRLNEVPKDSNSGLPADVTEDIHALGCRPCASLDDMLATLREVGG